MKKNKLRFLFAIFFGIIFVAVLSSSFFCVKSIEIVFLNEDFIKIEKESDLFFENNLDKIDLGIEKSVIGKSIFLLDKSFFTQQIEENNCLIKVLKVEKVFPNKIVLNVKERNKIFTLTDGIDFFGIDEEFKVIEKGKNELKDEILIEGLDCRGCHVNYFQFFEIPTCLYEEGLFLTENNLAIKNIANVCTIFGNKNLSIKNVVERITFFEEGEFLNVSFSTRNDFGVKLKVMNILEDFDYKFSKLLDAMRTLASGEKIKTTYGELVIDKSSNVFWNNL